MDIKLLEGSAPGTSLGIEALISVASRQKRKDFFYRSLLRCGCLTLLFIAFGCFLAISKEADGVLFSLFKAEQRAGFDFRAILKELFLLSVFPTVCFSLCFALGGRLCRLCDTVFPALYGTAAGAFYYTEISKLAASFSLSYTLRISPYILHVLLVITVYTLFFAVCASYGECKRKTGTLSSDVNNCFTYFLASLTALVSSVILRDAAVMFFGRFG